jgi:hypothetical protein
MDVEVRRDGMYEALTDLVTEVYGETPVEILVTRCRIENNSLREVVLDVVISPKG